jgi:5-methylcytosine-specific restriction endonuclease McrA
MTKARRLRIWERDNGICYLCQRKVKAGEAWDADHVKAWTIYGDDSDENLKVAHKEVCHKAKTDADMKIVRKSNRQGMLTGQQARRAKRDKPLIVSRGFQKNGPKMKIPSRPFSKKGRET